MYRVNRMRVEATAIEEETLTLCMESGRNIEIDGDDADLRALEEKIWRDREPVTIPQGFKVR